MFRKLLFLLLFVPVIGAQEPTRPFPNHETPPPGWTCSPTGQGMHECHCKRMNHPTNPADLECCDGPVTEDPQCQVYCHKDHCGCPIACEKSIQQPSDDGEETH